MSPVVMETESAATISVRFASSKRVTCAVSDSDSPITASRLVYASTLTAPVSIPIPSGTESSKVGELTVVFPPTCTSTDSLMSTTVDPAIATSAPPPAIAPSLPAALSRKPRPVSKSMSSDTLMLEPPVAARPKPTVLREILL